MNDIYSIIARLDAVNEGAVTPTALKKDLNPQQKSVPQLPALFKPNKISVLGAKTDPKHPARGFAVGASESVGDVEEGWKDAVAAGTLAAANLIGSPAQATEPVEKPVTIAYVTIDGETRKYDLGDRFKNSKDAEKFISDVLDRQGLSGYHLEIRTGYRKPQDQNSVRETMMAAEDVLGKIRRDLSDYLRSVEDELVGHDRSLIRKAKQAIQQPEIERFLPVKTLTTDDGKEIRIHGNEDDGFRISVAEKVMPTTFESIEEASMACEMYCARRRAKNPQTNSDYVDERGSSV